MNGVRVKICGVTTPEAARQAIHAGADAIGINFYPPSLRYVEPRLAATWLAHLPPFVDVVGVFAETPIRQVCALAYQLGLRVVQYHQETPEPQDTAPFAFVPGLRIRDLASLQAVRTYLERATQLRRRPAAVLVDAHVVGQLGGTGQVVDWTILSGFDPGVPLILAGGLTPENVAEAVRLVRPFAVDVASGVESSPGVKDPVKVAEFVRRAKEA